MYTAIVPGLPRARPLDKLDKVIPQPLKAEAKVEVDLPPEARALMRDLHRDRALIGAGAVFVLLLLAAAVCRYVLGGFFTWLAKR